jgi:hypothetical protein
MREEYQTSSPGLYRGSEFLQNNDAYNSSLLSLFAVAEICRIQPFAAGRSTYWFADCAIDLLSEFLLGITGPILLFKGL